MCGPSMFRKCFKNANIDMVCKVFPSPISSARMPLIPRSYKPIIKLRPSTWYGRILPVTFGGCTLSRVVPCGSSLSSARRSSSSSFSVIRLREPSEPFATPALPASAPMKCSKIFDCDRRYFMRSFIPASFAARTSTLESCSRLALSESLAALPCAFSAPSVFPLSAAAPSASCGVRSPSSLTAAGSDAAAAASLPVAPSTSIGTRSPSAPFTPHCMPFSAA
mmetsp:Transcript_3884/g.10697  ORF Transcript_3884/g.10697 Transcript_3884/m.10697 type:complete len:222 (-) Transcript_3884:34-699(-)